MSWDYTFTVFTPTYNRAHTLPKLFESRQQQTFEDFEWLVVDDGSTDDTADKIKEWQSESQFPIRYLKQENRGKPAATNHGVRKAAGELFLVIDSDDHLVPSTLETFWHHWRQIPDEDRPDFAGVGGLCAYESGEIAGTSYPKSPLDTEPVKLYRQFGVEGAKKWFVRTEIRRQFPNPIFEGEKYIPESVVWNRIGQEYLFRFVNDVVCIIEYQPDGITHNWLDLMRSCSRGFRLQMQELVEREQELAVPLTKRASHAAHYWRYSLHGRARLSQIIREGPRPLSLLLLSAPLGYLRYIADKIKINKS